VEKGALKVFWLDLRRASSALGEGQSWTSGAQEKSWFFQIEQGLTG